MNQNTEADSNQCALCKVKVFQDLKMTWCLIDVLLFGNERRKKRGKKREPKGVQTKQWLNKALLKHFYFHQKSNVSLIDGVMLTQCWQDQNETQNVEKNFLQALTSCFSFVFRFSIFNFLPALCLYRSSANRICPN